MSASAQASRRARRSRNKGAEGEREIVNLHKAEDVHAERVPLSGAMAYRENGEDVDVYILGRDETPLVCQVKRQKDDRGWRTLLSQLGEADGLFFRSDKKQWHVVLPIASYLKLVRR
jgi:hypothetical protein